MDLYINNEKIDFKLEGEKNSYDIVKSVGDYASKSKPQHFITAIKINNKEYSYVDEKNLKKIDINNIQEIKFETADVYEITSLSINQIEKFLKILKNLLLEKKIYENIVKTNDSIDWMKEGINQIKLLYDAKNEFIGNHTKAFNDNCNNLHDYFKSIEINNKTDSKDINNGINLINNISTNINDIKDWLIQTYRLPDREYVFTSLNKEINDIEEIIPRLENISILYQTGEDNETMNIIKKLTEILEKSISLFIIFKESFKLHLDDYTVKEVSFDEYFQTITDHLKDLMQAIQNKDYVIVGDLLEYEFVPNLTEIKNILIKIKEEAFTKAN